MPSKGKASNRQTKSQQEAFQKLKEKSVQLAGSGTGVRGNQRYGKQDKSQQPNRKVVNYANQNDFQHP